MDYVDDDREFFESNPGRTHRVRPASTAEVAKLGKVSAFDAEPPAGWRWYAAIKQIEPGKRARALFLGPVENEASCDDLSDDDAAYLFQREV